MWPMPTIPTLAAHSAHLLKPGICRYSSGILSLSAVARTSGGTGRTPVHFAGLHRVPQLAREGEGRHAAEFVADFRILVRAILEFVLDHPALEAVRALGDDPDLVLAQVLDVVLHLGGEELRADAQAALDRQGVEAHAELGLHVSGS